MSTRVHRKDNKYREIKLTSKFSAPFERGGGVVAVGAFVCVAPIPKEGIIAKRSGCASVL